tara:strand:+ start:2653 stop:3087 length:435 start_codon:yes stop_codon:yes gene_type:complete
MAYIGDELRAYLKTKSAVTLLVGSGANARIFEHIAKPKSKLPYLVVRPFGGRSAEHLGGIEGNATRRFQIDAYAATPEAADALQEAVRLAPLQAYRGNMNNTFVNNVESDGTSRTGVDPPTKGDNTFRHFSSRDYLVWYTEATS